MKILVIGDPHGNKIKRKYLEQVDLILITGDLGKADLARRMAFDNINRTNKGLPKKEYNPKQEQKAFMQAYNSTIKLMSYYSKFALVYTIFGNVESSNKETKRLSKNIGIKLPLLENKLRKMSNIKVINNKSVDFNGIKIGGLNYFIDTSWVKTFRPKDYKKRMKNAKTETNKAKKVLKNFNDLDILLCHQPPYKILDKVGPHAPKAWRGKHAGSKIILNFIKKKKPRYVFCGHIHESKGVKKVGKTRVENMGYNGNFSIIRI